MRRMERSTGLPSIGLPSIGLPSIGLPSIGLPCIALLAILFATARCDPDGGSTAAAPDVVVGDGAPTAPAVVTTSAELTAALAAAVDGAEIVLEAGTFEGTFRVPAGVTLRGQGADETVLRGTGAVAVVLDGDGATTLEALRVEANGWGVAAVPGDAATANGPVTLRDVQVAVTAETAVACQGVRRFTLERVSIAGNVVEADVPGVDVDRDRDRYALVGLRIHECDDAAFSEVDVSGFATYGVVSTRSTWAWTVGTVERNLGIGLLVADGSTATASDVLVRETWGGRYPFGWGAAVIDGSRLDTARATFRRNVVGLALLGDPDGGIRAPAGVHTDLVVEEGGVRGLWIQDVRCDPACVRIEGTGTRFLDNAGIALGILDSSGVEVLAGSFSGTTRIPFAVEGTDALVEEVGDGIHIVRSDALRFRSASLVDNARAGFLLEGVPRALPSGTLLDVSFEGVEISGERGERGFSLQNAALQDGSGAPVVADPTLSAADADAEARGVVLPFARAVDTAGIVTPGGDPPRD